jgi:hypothetical protein
MTNRLGRLAAVCAAAGLLAGCGSGGTKTVTVTTPAATTPSAAVTTPTTATTPSTTTPATGTTSTTATSPTAAQIKAAEAANPQLKKELTDAVAACKSSVAATPSLKPADRAKLSAICDDMSSGNTAAVQQATAEVCQQIIKDSVPAAAQAQALASCPKP